MQDDKITTSTLLQKLFKTSSITRFIKHYDEQMKPTYFSEYLSILCKNRKTISEHVIIKSGIERTYGHQIFNGRRKPSRDKVIQLAFGFGMNYDEAQELLKVARKSPLYPKIKRDAVVIYALKHKLTIGDVQATLCDLTLPLLGKEERYE